MTLSFKRMTKLYPAKINMANSTKSYPKAPKAPFDRHIFKQLYPAGQLLLNFADGLSGTWESTVKS